MEDPMELTSVCDAMELTSVRDPMELHRVAIGHELTPVRDPVELSDELTVSPYHEFPVVVYAIDPKDHSYWYTIMSSLDIQCDSIDNIVPDEIPMINQYRRTNFLLFDIYNGFRQNGIDLNTEYIKVQLNYKTFINKLSFTAYPKRFRSHKPYKKVTATSIIIG